MASFPSPDSFSNDNGYHLMASLLRIHSNWKKLKENMINIGASENCSLKAILYKVILYKVLQKTLKSPHTPSSNVFYLCISCFVCHATLFTLSPSQRYSIYKYMPNKYSKPTREFVNASSSTGRSFPYSCDSTNRHCNKIYACTLPHNLFTTYIYYVFHSLNQSLHMSIYNFTSINRLCEIKSMGHVT